MFKNFNQHWNKNGSLKIKFRSPLFVNSKLITNIKIKKIDKNNDNPADNRTILVEKFILMT